MAPRHIVYKQGPRCTTVVVTCHSPANKSAAELVGSTVQCGTILSQTESRQQGFILSIETPESFLSSGIPDLKFDSLPRRLNHSHSKLHANCV